MSLRLLHSLVRCVLRASPRVGHAMGAEAGYVRLYHATQARRGALELVVTGALSHPNIVQVRGSFWQLRRPGSRCLTACMLNSRLGMRKAPAVQRHPHGLKLSPCSPVAARY
jgi:hypothetical protein